MRLIAPTSLLIFSVLPVFEASAEEPRTARKADMSSGASESTSPHSSLDNQDELPENWMSHPLARTLEFAAERQTFINTQVNDFSCVLAKRERINGRLRDYEYLRTIVRRGRKAGDQIIPFSVFAEFLAPKKVQGRRVLYVEGQNENKMLVRNGGIRFAHVIVNIAPTSDAALRETRYPITELGLSNVVSRLIDQARHDIIADPDAENTEVVFYRDAEIDGRVCTHIRVTHPVEDHIFTFHQANVYVDDELNVPLRVETYAWPKKAGDPAVLLEEYTYMKLKLNVGLTDKDFSEELIRNDP
ncbi:MAG: DUF1571 domain-containing protein [Planctomycetaceae bacterium]|nr:DUF1571 domain-containing protein [Planctomycetales bacterium]MCB9927251.1 DUF1571 domain-containing protein [Planctomycetaceae bacterium]